MYVERLRRVSTNWAVANERAEKTAAPWIAASCASWVRCISPRAREQARENVKYGIHKWMEYFARLNPLNPTAPAGCSIRLMERIELGNATRLLMTRLRYVECFEAASRASLCDGSSRTGCVRQDDQVLPADGAARGADFFKMSNLSRQASYDIIRMRDYSRPGHERGLLDPEACGRARR